jgi:Fe2+ transport system protein FeoA
VPTQQTFRLNELKQGARAIIVDVNISDLTDFEVTPSTPILMKRLKDLGFSHGETLHLLGRSPTFNGKGALRVMVGQTHIALRHYEARHVVVEVLS